MNINMISNDKQWCLYKHTNLINGKVYIGITSQKPIYRWGHNGHNYIGQEKFFRAVQKYGWDNFSHEILFENLTKEQALLKESELIIENNAIVNGYNSPAKFDGELYSKSVYCVETEEIFPSVSSAARAYNKCATTLSHHLNGDKGFRLAYGKHWYFLDDSLNNKHYESDYLYEKKEEEKKKEETEIIQLYQSGKTIRQINEQSHVSCEKISRILKENNIELRTRSITAIALDKNTLMPIKSFLTLKEACEWCGIDGNNGTERIKIAIEDSWRICKGYKWTTTNEEFLKVRTEKEKIYNKNNPPIKAIVEDYKNGLTTEEIGNKYGFCQPVISKLLKNNGITINVSGQKSILQVDPQTMKVIKVFSSMKEVYNSLNMSPNNPTLGKRCRDHKLYKNYIWYFIDDYDFEEDTHKYDF